MRETYRTQLAPAVASVGASGRSAVASARDRLSDDVLPTISGAIGSALAMIDVANDPRVRDVIKRAGSASARFGRAVPVIEPPKKSGAGKYILLGFGVVATAAVLYAAWQTLRADDELWIEDLGDPGEDTASESAGNE
jgi:hypothetical protein